MTSDKEATANVNPVRSLFRFFFVSEKKIHDKDLRLPVQTCKKNERVVKSRTMHYTIETKAQLLFFTTRLWRAVNLLGKFCARKHGLSYRET